MKIKIVIYDDNVNFSKSLSLLINEEMDMEVSANFFTAIGICEDIEHIKPDVILMDIDMPQLNGVEAVKKIRSANNLIPIIMLTVFEDNDNIFNAIYAGASGYILKKNAGSEIPDAIRNVLLNGAPMTGIIAKKVLQMMSQQKPEENNFKLTHHEKDVLFHLVNGLSYKMIAAELSISIDTVRFHIKKIYEKLHVHSATEAVSIAIRKKLV